MSDPSDDLIGNQQFDDLDGDGVVDTVVEYFDDNSSIATYDTDGDGLVDAADIDSDGDGKVDLAVIDLGNGQVGVYEDPSNTTAEPVVVDLEEATDLAPDLVETFGDELGESEFEQTGFEGTDSDDDEDDDDTEDDDEDEDKDSDKDDDSSSPTSWFADADDKDKDDADNVDFDDEKDEKDDDAEDDGKHPQGDPNSTSLVGDPFGDAELWFEQAVNGTCGPATIAQIVSEYTGETFANEEEFAAWAVDNGVMEVLPDGTTTGMYAPDIVEMLESYGVPAELEQNLEIQDLKEMLADDVGVAVMVDANEYWGPMYGYDPGPENDAINHIVMVTGIDEEKGVVYINDTGTPDGEALEVPIEYFEDAWDDGDNQAIVCDEPAPETAASTVGSGVPQSDSVSSLLDGKWALLPVVLRGDEVAAAQA